MQTMGRPRKQQESLPGAEYQRPTIPEVEEAAEEYRALRDDRMALAEREGITKKLLVAKMVEHSVTVFRYVDPEGVERRVTLETSQKAKIGKVKGQGKSDNAPADEDGQDVEVH